MFPVVTIFEVVANLAVCSSLQNNDSGLYGKLGEDGSLTRSVPHMVLITQVRGTLNMLWSSFTLINIGINNRACSVPTYLFGDQEFAHTD
jgi:hypothetical protein